MKCQKNVRQAAALYTTSILHSFDKNRRGSCMNTEYKANFISESNNVMS